MPIEPLIPDNSADLFVFLLIVPRSLLCDPNVGFILACLVH